MDAARNILRKLGIEPDSRIRLNDQDFQYTACKVSELDGYYRLYNQIETTTAEKRVLGCFFKDGLNDFVQTNETAHPIQDKIFDVMHRDFDIHQTELAYWTDIENNDETSTWPIRKYVLE